MLDDIRTNWVGDRWIVVILLVQQWYQIVVKEADKKKDKLSVKIV